MSSIIRFLLISLIAGSNVLAQDDATSNGPSSMTASVGDNSAASAGFSASSDNSDASAGLSAAGLSAAATNNFGAATGFSADASDNSSASSGFSATGISTGANDNSAASAGFSNSATDNSAATPDTGFSAPEPLTKSLDGAPVDDISAASPAANIPAAAPVAEIPTDDVKTAPVKESQATVAPVSQNRGDFEKNEEHREKIAVDTPYVKGESEDHSKFHEKKSGTNYEKNTLDEHADWKKTHNSFEKNNSKKTLDIEETANSRISKEESHSSSYKETTRTNCPGCKPVPACPGCIKPVPTPIVCNDCHRTCTECIPIPRPCYDCFTPKPVCLTCLIPIEVKKNCITCVQIVPSFNPFINIFTGYVDITVIKQKTSYEEQLQEILLLLFKQSQKKEIVIKKVESTFEKFIKKIQLELALIQELALRCKTEDQIKVIILEPKFQPLCQTIDLTPSIIGGMSISAIGQQVNAARYQIANTAEVTFGKYQAAYVAQGYNFASIQSQYNGFGKFYQSVSSSISASASFFSSSFGSSSSSIGSSF